MNNGRLLKKMSLREKVLQIIFPCLKCDKPQDKIFGISSFTENIQEYPFGGFLIQNGDIYETPMDINTLQRYSKLPLLFSIDAERGTGCQIKNTIELPGQMAIGVVGDEELAANAGEITAQNCGVIGINVVFSPVLDVNTEIENPIINSRAYGSDANLVSRLGKAFISAVQKNNIIATAKHFPGHGASKIDSHIDTPIIDIAPEEFYKVHIKPFIDAVNAGVKAIMTAHVIFPSFDSEYPATLSYKIIHKILRESLMYEGLIFSDAFVMDSIKNFYSQVEATVLAINAGVDVILYPENPYELADELYEIVQKDTSLEEKIDKSVQRIFEAKNFVGIFENRYSDVRRCEILIENESQKRFATELARKSITQIKIKELLQAPLKFFKNPSLLIIAHSKSADYAFVEKMKEHISEKNIFVVSERDLDNFNEMIQRLKVSDLIISVFFNTPRAYLNETIFNRKFQIFEAIIKELRFKETSIKFISIVFGNPYISKKLELYSDVIFIAYWDESFSQEAVIERLTGINQIQT